MATPLSPDADAFLRSHTWGILATGRRDGSPQQSMIGYVVDDDGRIVVSIKSYTAKWKNARRQPRVSLAVADGHAHLVIYGEAEAIEADPDRADLTADVFAGLSGAERPDPATMIAALDEQQRTVLRITPTSATFIGV